MAKAKRERRSSIRTMPADDALSALDKLEAAERRSGDAPPAGQPGGDAGSEAHGSDRDDDGE